MFDDYEFALCLTHDVDRPYKTFQSPYYAVKERDVSHLRSLASSERPYWQFEEIMELEEELGVRSTFFFLNEKQLFRDKKPLDWVKPKNWKLFTGRYDITDEEVVDVIQTLDESGWEIGLHGSYESYKDIERLRYEKETLEVILGHEIAGGRQHYLNLEQPKTWEYHQEIGLQYDASLGSSTTFGFNSYYELLHPLNNDFVVFPLTAMETAIMNASSKVEAVKTKCYRLLEEARDNNAIMTILWHPRFFNELEFGRYREVFIYIVNTAKEMNAWIGPCGEYYTLSKEDA